MSRQFLIPGGYLNEGTGTRFYSIHQGFYSETGVAVQGSGESGSTGFLNGWQHYCEITPQHNPVTGLSGFPLFIPANSIPFLWYFAKTDLSDIRVTDLSNNFVPCHILNVDYASRSGFIVAKVNKEVTSQTFRVHFGNPFAEAVPATGEFGQYNTYDSGIVSCYPSGNGIDVTRYQNHITGSYTPHEDVVSLGSGPSFGLHSAAYSLFTGSSGETRPFASGNPTGLPLSLSAFSKTADVFNNSFGQSSLVSLLGYDLPTGPDLQSRIHHYSLTYSSTGTDAAFPATSGQAQLRISTGNRIPGTIFAADDIFPIDKYISANTWHHYGATVSSDEISVVLDDDSALVTGITRANVPTGISSLHLGGYSYRFNDIYARGNSNANISMVFVQNKYQPTGWFSYMYKQVSQENFFGSPQTISSGIYSHAHIQSELEGGATNNRHLNTISDTRTIVFGSSQISHQGLFGHWELQDTGNTTSIEARVGPDGILSGNPSSRHASTLTKFGPNDRYYRSLGFEGADGSLTQTSCVDIPPQGFLKGVTGFTLSAWMNGSRITATSQVHPIIQIGEFDPESNQQRASIEFASRDFHATGCFQIQGAPSDGSSLALQSPLNYDVSKKWYHIIGAANLADNYIRLYVNGEIVHSGTFTGPNPTFDNSNPSFVRIGGLRPQSSFSVASQLNIADARIYNSGLTHDQCLALYSAVRDDWTQWDGYYELTPINPSGELEGFPLLLDLTLCTGLSNVANADGGDIRTTDTGNNRLAMDLIYYENGSGLVVINPETKTTETQPVRVWAGNPNAIDIEPSSTWGQYNAYYTGMTSFYPSGGYQDRTRNQNHLTMSGIISGTGFISGFNSSVATRYYGDSPNTYGIVTGGNIQTGVPFTLISWVNPQQSAHQTIMAVEGDSFANKSYLLQLTNTEELQAIVNNGNNNLSDVTVPLQQWSHTAGRFYPSGTEVGPSDTIVSGNVIKHVSQSSEFAQPMLYNTLGGARFSTGVINELFGALAFSQIHDNLVPNAWVYYDYLMGQDHRAFWNGGATFSNEVNINAGSTSNVVTRSYYSPNLNRIINVVSNTHTSSFYGLNLEKILNSTSNTRTSSRSSAEILQLLNTVINVFTSSHTNQINLEGILRATSYVFTSEESRANLSARLSTLSNSRTYMSASTEQAEILLETIANIKTATYSSPILLNEINTIVNVVTSSSSAVVNNIQILTDCETQTSLIGRVRFEGTIASISEIKTALEGSAIVVGEAINPNTVEFTVYLNLESLLNLYICRNNEQ